MEEDNIYPSRIEIAIDELIKYCRHKQKEYVENSGEISGIEIIIHMLQKGEIELATFFSIFQAVQNYKAPYELKITKS